MSRLEVTKDDKCLNKNNIGLYKMTVIVKWILTNDIYSGEKEITINVWSKQCQAREGIDNL